MKNSSLVPSIILGLCFMLGLWIYGQRPATDEVITITGSAKETVTADLAGYNVTFDRTYSVDKGLSASMSDFDAKTKEVVAILQSLGATKEEITIGATSVQKIYEQNGYYMNTQNIMSYSLSRSVSLETKDVQKVKTIAEKINAEAAKKDIAFSSSNPTYQYTGLESLRPKLLNAATEDAKKKAEAMTSSVGRTIGSLRAGKMGVVQVLAKNSIEVSDYGSYDLSSPEKDIFVTVNVTFALK